jgi:hypothetical protein
VHLQTVGRADLRDVLNKPGGSTPEALIAEYDRTE